jgi:6-phosphogluconolactonase
VTDGGVTEGGAIRTRSGASLVVVPDGLALAEAAADRIVASIVDAIDARTDARALAHVALTGGSTPAAIFQRLAVPPRRDAVPWERVHLWWGDDRFVARSDPLSNAWIADRHLFRAPDGGPGIPVPARQVHPFRCGDTIAAGLGPDACAAAYADELRAVIGPGSGDWPAFDLLLVGIGPDGHLLSVFPDSAAFGSDGWAVGIPAPTHIGPHVPRVTLNPAVVAAARTVLATVAGASKAEILAAVFAEGSDERHLPARLALRPGAIWIVDEAAASGLSLD